MSAVRGVGGWAFLRAQERRALTGPVESCPFGADPADAADPDAAAAVPPLRLIAAHAEARRFLTEPHWSRAAVGRDPAGPASVMSVTDMDAPQHTRVRSLLNTAFAARSVQQSRPRLERRARELLSVIRAAGHPSEVIAEFCTPFTFHTNCDLLGVPDRARAELHHWSLARAADPDADAEQIYQAELGLHEAVVRMFDELRRHPRDGLFARLSQARADGALTEDELTGLAASMFFDGHLLAAGQLALALLCLLGHPDQLARLRADPARLIPGAVEEVLRYSPAITVGMTRISTSPAPGTAPAPAAPPTAVAFGLVNRDPEVFEAAEEFDIARSPNPHLSFGRGAHHCLGAELMRLELQVALDAMLRELPGLRLAVDASTLGWSASPSIRALDALPLAWDGPARAPRGARKYGPRS